MIPITTVTFFKYTSLQNKWWALGQMGRAHQTLREVEGLLFYKLLGSGRGLGFSPWPDWGVYGLLQNWDDMKSARNYFQSDSHDEYQKRTSECWTLFLQPISLKGSWSGIQPFQTVEEEDNLPIAVITRATIRWSKLLSFWRFVPIAQRPLVDAKGLRFAKGVGEVPLIQMATFSLWENKSSLKLFAYQSDEHAEAIRKTRSLNWYKEEMFVRFQVIGSRGTWNGQLPIRSALEELE